MLFQSWLWHFTVISLEMHSQNEALTIKYLGFEHISLPSKELVVMLWTGGTVCLKFSLGLNLSDLNDAKYLMSWVWFLTRSSSRIWIFNSAQSLVLWRCSIFFLWVKELAKMMHSCQCVHNIPVISRSAQSMETVDTQIRKQRFITDRTFLCRWCSFGGIQVPLESLK